MLSFIRKNVGLISFIILLLTIVLGGIWWVETSLTAQEQIIN